ncbi:MAG: hypothetical protein AABX28_02640, partial [Nanoarchaeota archaeon]
KRGLFSLSFLFILTLISYFLPAIFSIANLRKLSFIYLTKPFFSIIGLFNLRLLYTSAPVINIFTNSYYISGKIIVENFSPLVLTLFLAAAIPLTFLILACYFFSKQDIM